jgi:hypothetical protein
MCETLWREDWPIMAFFLAAGIVFIISVWRIPIDRYNPGFFWFGRLFFVVWTAAVAFSLADYFYHTTGQTIVIEAPADELVISVEAGTLCYEGQCSSIKWPTAFVFQVPKNFRRALPQIEAATAPLSITINKGRVIGIASCGSKDQAPS